MQVFVGTSGYNYPEWRGSFYPEKFSTDKMLAYYAERFRTVEINYTFYRMPNEKLLSGWAAGTPEGFSFTLKAPRRITHDTKLQHCEELLHSFCTIAATLGPKLATLLFQLPPTFKKDAEVLRAFTELIPDGTRAAFEFRHASWFDGDIYEILRSRNLALCVADSEKMSAPLELTANYAYSPAPGRGLSAIRPRALGRCRRRPAESDRRVRLLQARGAGAGSGIRAALHRAASGGGSRDLIGVDMCLCRARELMVES